LLGVALALGGCALPHPLTDAERLAEEDRDRIGMFGNQEPLRHPLTLHEAFARALKYNLDGRVKLIEEALSQDDLDLSRRAASYVDRILRGEKIQAIAYNQSPVCEPYYLVCYQQSGGSG